MSMETKHPPSHGQGSTVGSGYEQRDANIPDLLKFGFWMAVVIMVTLVSMRWTFNFFERTQTVSSPATPFVRPRELPPSPRLQAEPHFELREYCEQQQREVNSYGWIDPRLKVVRIPISQAMDLVLKNGLPVRASGPTGAAAVEVPPPMSAGGDDLQGPCAYLAPASGNASGNEAPEK